MLNSIYAILTNTEIFAASCRTSFFGIPTWHKYLPTKDDAINQCVPVLKGLNDLWLIGLAFVEILTRVAVFVSIGFIIYAGIKYSASRGNTDKVNSAKYTLLDALTGLVIAIVATAVISFLAERISQA